MKRLSLIAVLLAAVAIAASPALVYGQTTTTATPAASTTNGDTVITVPAEVSVPTAGACAGGVGIGLTLLIAAARIARMAGYDVPYLTPILDMLARHRPGRMPGVGGPFNYRQPPDAGKGPVAS